MKALLVTGRDQSPTRTCSASAATRVSSLVARPLPLPHARDQAALQHRHELRRRRLRDAHLGLDVLDVDVEHFGVSSRLPQPATVSYTEPWVLYGVSSVADLAPRSRSHRTSSSAFVRCAASSGVRFSRGGTQFGSASRAKRYSAASSCPP